MNTASFESAYLSLVKDNRIFDSALDKSARIISRQCALALSVSRASVWISKGEDAPMRCLSAYSVENDSFESGATLDSEMFPGYFSALENGRVIDVSDALTDPRTSELCAAYLEPLNVLSLLDATLRNQGEVTGVMCFEMVGQQRQWNKEEEAFVASVADLVSQRLIVDELALSEEKFNALYQHTSDGICVFGDGLCTDVNPAMCSIFRGGPEEFMGKSLLDLSPEFQCDGVRSADRSIDNIERCLNGDSPMYNWTHQRLDGTSFQAEVRLNAIKFEGEDTLFAHVRDISDRIEAENLAAIAHEKLEFRGAHDQLTGLRNRGQLHQYVSRLITGNTGTKKPNVALLLLDLNRFKEVNDTLGHTTGDKVLVELSVVLAEKVRENGGSLFRLGGDEFGAVFDSRTCAVPFEDLESLLHQGLKTKLLVDDMSVEMGASIGMALFPKDGKDSHELLRCADVAMYYAKNNNKASCWYDPENDVNNKRRLAIRLELGSAIKENQLSLYFQPRINLHTGEVAGCEALLRWNHPKLGRVPPGEFLPLAEMTEAIHPLTDWVLHNTIAQVESMLENGYRIPIAMNISSRNLTDSRLVDTIEQMVVEKKLDPSLLEIEITESALIKHPALVVENLEKLNRLGISIAIDDFGTGYSSLSYLKKLPLDTLKIDRIFVCDMLTEESDSVIVDSTIDLAHNFSLSVVAEGVEDKETLEALIAKGCDQAQGYFIAKPMSAEDFDVWMTQRSDKYRGDTPV
jgi:diguanylate cyclase (GGDEF)-like protein/PAS domain S-box-containing protein